MRKSSWTDHLGRATKTTVVICGVLLVLTAVTVVLLMFFPIKKVDTPTVVVEPPRHTEYSATTPMTTIATTTHDGPHTLSTWDAGVSGYSRSLDEFMETKGSATTDPRLWRATTNAPKTATTVNETVATLDPEAQPVVTTGAEHPQTVTTTVAQVPTEELTAPPLPVEFEEAGGEE